MSPRDNHPQHLPILPAQLPLDREQRAIRDRAILDRRLDGQSIRTIAAEVDLSPSRVRDVINSGLRRLEQVATSLQRDAGVHPAHEETHRAGNFSGPQGGPGTPAVVVAERQDVIRCAWCHELELVDAFAAHAADCRAERDRRGRAEASLLVDAALEHDRAARRTEQAYIAGGGPLRW